jgi:hypothetical protein
MRHRRAFQALSAVCLLAAAWVVLPLMATADEPVETGWWDRNNGGNVEGAPVTSPRGPDVPEGGLLVAADPSGPAGVSALRFNAAVETSSTLTLVPAEGLPALQPPVILACPQSSEWLAADNGLWFTRPEPDCDAARVVGNVEDGAMTWSLTPDFKLAGQPYISVILVPAEDPQLFRVAFEAPGKDSLTAPVDLTGTTTSTTEPPPVTTTSTAPPTTQPTVVAGADDEKTFGGPAVASPGSGSGSGRVPAVDTAPPPPAPPPPAANREIASGPVPQIPASNSTPERMGAAFLLLLLGAAAFLASTGRLPALAGVGAGTPAASRASFDDDETVEVEVTPAVDQGQGVGRFVRPRDGAPPPL